jgi:hypothetical protein
MARKSALGVVTTPRTDAQLVAALRREADRLAALFRADAADMLDAIVSALPDPLIERAVAALSTMEDERAAA